jgi:hypothetical protein
VSTRDAAQLHIWVMTRCCPRTSPLVTPSSWRLWSMCMASQPCIVRIMPFARLMADGTAASLDETLPSVLVVWTTDVIGWECRLLS